MKTLVCLLMLAMSVPVLAGPRIVGNGGGGVRQNGVYKTFHSAKVYINPEEETEIPGSELYTSIIKSLTGDTSTARLLSVGLPLGERKFFKIAEDKMDETIMARLIEEYARVVGQTKDSLTIFAITDIRAQTTYLLPTFYQLSEIEQASILFHEAYWILKPNADYSEVVSAEIAFQKFAESKQMDKFDPKLPRLLGKLLENPLLSVKTAWLEDSRRNNGGVVSSQGKILFKHLFANSCKPAPAEVGYSNRTFKMNYYYDHFLVDCTLNAKNIEALMEISNKYPKSFFLKEMMYFVTTGHSIKFRNDSNYNGSFFQAPTEKKIAQLRADYTSQLNNYEVGMDNLDLSYGYEIKLPNFKIKAE